MNENSVHNIIVANNHPIVIQGLISVFAKAPNMNTVGIVQTGEELIDMLGALDADTVIMDLKLSSTNIYRLIKDLIVTRSDVKLIAFTNYTMPKLIQDTMEFGMHAYLAQTASIAEIKDSIDRVHSGGQYICSSVYQKNKQSRVSKTNNFAAELDQDFIRFSELTAREMDIVILVSRGFTDKEMADKLFLSKSKIETYRHDLMSKLKLKTSGQLIFFASQQGIV